MSDAPELESVVSSLEEIAMQTTELALEEPSSPNPNIVEDRGVDSEAVQGTGMDVVMRMPVSIEIVLGSTKMPLSKLMKLSRGSIIALDRRVGEPVDVVVNDRVVARGEVVILDEVQSLFGVCLTELVRSDGNDR